MHYRSDHDNGLIEVRRTTEGGEEATLKVRAILPQTCSMDRGIMIRTGAAAQGVSGHDMTDMLRAKHDSSTDTCANAALTDPTRKTCLHQILVVSNLVLCASVQQ